MAVGEWTSVDLLESVFCRKQAALGCDEPRLFRAMRSSMIDIRIIVIPLSCQQQTTVTMAPACSLNSDDIVTENIHNISQLNT